MFVDPDAFGTAATYRAATGEAGQALNVLFTNAYEAVSVVDGIEYATRTPAALIREADLSEPARRGAELDVDGTTYTVREPQPDGEGMALLILGTS